MTEDDNELVRLARIETKIDLFRETHYDHEGRIRKLERAVYLATGAAAVFGGAIGTFLTKVLEAGP